MDLPSEKGTNPQAMPGADALGDDLSKDKDESGGAEDGRDASTKDTVHDDGEGLIDERIGQEEGNEEQVTICPDGTDTLGPCPLHWRTGLFHDQEVHVIQGHEAQGESCQETPDQD